MLNKPTGMCLKIQVNISNLPEAVKNQLMLRYYFQALIGPVSDVGLFGNTAIVTFEKPTGEFSGIYTCSYVIIM